MDQTCRIATYPCLLLLVLGCSGKAKRIQPPDISPSAAATAAIRTYDTDGDGVLSRQELARCPGMLQALDLYDKNTDGKVGRDEISHRIGQWQATRVGRMSLTCTVNLDGAPLENATVQLIPEEFLGAAVQSAVGTTDRNGMALLSIAGVQPPGVQCGVYRVEITHPAYDLDSKYHVESTLGAEVSNDALTIGGLNFDLESS